MNPHPPILAGSALPAGKQASPGAFTLVELLVTLGILSILASLVFPALANAKKESQSSACQGHLQQLNAAWWAYAEENEDLLVPNRTRSTISEETEHRRSLPGSWVVGNARTDIGIENIRRGLLFDYALTPRIYSCPSDETGVAGEERIPRNRSYSMNGILNGGQECLQLSGSPGAQRLYSLTMDKSLEAETRTRLSQVSDADRVFVFLDVHEDSIDSGAFRLNPALERWDHLPAERHRKGANLSFADGHVEHYIWKSRKVFRSPHQPLANESDRADFNRLADAVLPRP